jgi:hypothetical protein
VIGLERAASRGQAAGAHASHAFVSFLLHGAGK